MAVAIEKRLTIEYQAKCYKRHFKNTDCARSVSDFFYNKADKLLSKFVRYERSEEGMTEGQINWRRELRFIEENVEEIEKAAYALIV